MPANVPNAAVEAMAPRERQLRRLNEEPVRPIRYLFWLLLIAVAPPLQAAKHSACSAPAYRQFDFFAGDWDTYDLRSSDPARVIARNRVNVILDGCVILEDYRQNDGHHGESFSLYDASTGKWHQTWVTNRGELLQLDGGVVKGRMILTGVQRTANGKPSLLRGVWDRQGDGVRETATRSLDGGKTWQPVFDILFRPHK